MRVAVVGAGAIGAFVGASLARGGSEVTLIARGAHLRAMQDDGVRVVSDEGEFTAHPLATDDFAAIADADVAFVALKAHTLPALAPEIARHLRPGATTVWGQNGIPWWYFLEERGALEGTTLESVDPSGAIWGSIDHASVVGCIVYCATEIVAPGVIRHVEGTRFTIGEPDGSRSPRCEELAAAFAAGGLRAPVEARLRDQIWLKLLGNASFNPITALTGSTLGELGELPEMLDLLRELFREIAAVASALGVTFPVSLDRRLRAGIAVGDHKTSMLQDLEAGKPLESDCMAGAVIELAQRLGIAVPRLQAVQALVTQLDRVRALRR
ncbi:MAG TPA: 2-dehydropantoate 2-reductase [Acidimicrobiales bacterium]|nr:2-dehydropantoate 2-reductase [Acidimicrobiales bacterium]